MENISLITISRLSIFVLFVLWIYFFIYSYRHKDIFPWGFSIVFIGLLVSGIGYHFYNNQVVIFSINLPLAVSLIGIVWNINNIRSQFYIRNIDEFLRFIGMGLMFGLLFGFFFIIAEGTKYSQVDSRYTMTIYIISSMQASVAEELLFRGYLLSYLQRYEFNSVFSVMFQALTFAILHIPRYPDNWMVIFIIFLAAVIAGYFTWQNRNLISALVLHIVLNLVAVVWWLIAS